MLREGGQIAGDSLYYEKQGEGEPIVFLNGFGLTHRMWREQVRHLSSSYSCITYDTRGFGRSPIPNKPYSHTEDLFNLIKNLGISQAHMVGLSLGGYISIDFALMFPELVKSLTLISPRLGGYPRKVEYKLDIEKGADVAKANWLSSPLFASARNKEKVFQEIQGIVSEYSGWHWMNTDPAIKTFPPAVERLDQILIPTQIITGENDLSYFSKAAEVIHKSINGAKRVIVKDAGHMVNMEQPEETNLLIENFINSI